MKVEMTICEVKTKEIRPLVRTFTYSLYTFHPQVKIMRTWRRRRLGIMPLCRR